MNMWRLMSYFELFVATVFFTITNAETNKRLGHTTSSNFRRNLQVNTDLRSLESDGPFLTGKIDTATILPLFDLIRESSSCAKSKSARIGFKSGPCGLFRMTLMIPDIRDINGRFIAAGFECQNNHDLLLDSLDSVALCTSDDDSESTLILVANLNEDNPLLTAIFDDINKSVKYQINTVVSSTDYYFTFSISKNEEVSMKVDTLVSPAVTQKNIPRIDLNEIHTIVNKSNATVGELKPSLRNELTRYGGNNKNDGKTVVDVLFYFTWRAMCQWTSQSYQSCTDNENEKMKLKNLVSTFVIYANKVYANSLINLSIKPIVHVGGKDGYDEGRFNNNPSNFLNDLTLNKVDDVQMLRNTYKADLVAGIAYGTIQGTSGIAWQPTTFPSRSLGFSATIGCGRNCDTIMSSTLTHEIGHNFGCDHDREVSNWINNDAKDSNFGFNNCEECVISIMSYYDHCLSNRCTYEQIKRIPYFSNPDIVYKGKKNNFNIGDNKRNNAQMIRNSKEVVASNRVKGLHTLELDDFNYWYFVDDYVVFTIEATTDITIKNLEIAMSSTETHTISILINDIDTEDYSVHVKQALDPLSQQGDIFSNVNTFNDFPPIPLANGEKMKFKVICDSSCIKYWSVSKNSKNKDDTIPGSTNEHILVKVGKGYGNKDSMFWGAIFYEPSIACNDHKGKFKWKEKKEKNCSWVQRKNKCSKKKAKQYCPKTCGIC